MLLRGSAVAAETALAGLEDEEEEENRLLSLRRNMEHEAAHNRSEDQRMCGEAVLYGQIIQLQHVSSGRYLTARKTMAKSVTPPHTHNSAAVAAAAVAMAATTAMAAAVR